MSWLRTIWIEFVGILPRRFAFWAGLRRRIGDEFTREIFLVPDLDTGGGFRAAFRQQNPSVDPREPYGGESSSTGTDHGWSNCTMSSAAMGMAYEQPQGSKVPWGGDMRHNQDDLVGGTDLYDARTAWSRYASKTLTIKTGSGWSAVDTAHKEGRAIIVQGTGNVPGSSSFASPHACIVAPETRSDGYWLFGDPNTTGWQWVSPSSIKTWMAAFHSGYAFAVGAKPPTPAPIPPDPTPVPPDPTPPVPIPPPVHSPAHPVPYASPALWDGVIRVVGATWEQPYTWGTGPAIWGKTAWDSASFVGT